MRIGRNDPCFCGSGKKYKKCCITNVDAQDGAMREPGESNLDILERAVPPEVIQSVMDEVDNWSPEDFRKLTERFLKEHPVLLVFVTAWLTPLPNDVRGHSLLVVCTLIRTFEKHYGRNHEPIIEADVRQVIDRNMRLMEEPLRDQDPGDVVQPFLLKFISDTAFDFDDDELPESRDQYSLFLIMKSTVDLLDRSYCRKGVLSNGSLVTI
jgi:hypothetical protein